MNKPLFYKCNNCTYVHERSKIVKEHYVCSVCGHYETLYHKNRINLVVDKDSFEEFNQYLDFNDPIGFPGYKEKYDSAKAVTKMNEAVITGTARIDGREIMIGVMDSRFMMGSMGIVVGEKITRLFEMASERSCPVILFTASGGARMQEGMFALMQMAKTSAAVAKYSESGGLFISVLTNPTTGGVSASFAFLGDIILSEPNALIGFAGRRVIEQTIKEKLPDDFQSAEFLLNHGFIDAIVERRDMKSVLSLLLKYHEGK